MMIDSRARACVCAHVCVCVCVFLLLLSGCQAVVTRHGQPVRDQFAQDIARSLRASEIASTVVLDAIASSYQAGLLDRDVVERAIAVASDLHVQIRSAKSALSEYLDTGNGQAGVTDKLSLVRKLVDNLSLLAR